VRFKHALLENKRELHKILRTRLKIGLIRRHTKFNEMPIPVFVSTSNLFLSIPFNPFKPS